MELFAALSHYLQPPLTRTQSHVAFKLADIIDMENRYNLRLVYVLDVNLISLTPIAVVDRQNFIANFSQIKLQCVFFFSVPCSALVVFIFTQIY
jgi:hypothetical protein